MEDQLTFKLLSAEVPSCLRPISPFLSEAQRSLSNAYDPAYVKVSIRWKRLSVNCINHAFKLFGVLDINIDEVAKNTLINFSMVRDALTIELRLPPEQSIQLKDSTTAKPSLLHAEDLLIAESDEIMQLGEEQLAEGMREDAAHSFHTATVYYRVLESMLPNMVAELHGRLTYAAWRTRQCSKLVENFAVEHFSGETCSDVYEVNASSKLGKGSYGSVYLSTHRMTGDERAVKVMNVDRVTSYYLRKLHTEIAILRRVDHPNIIRLHDVFFGRRSVYLVTELCRGGELFELLTSGKSQGFVFREDRASRLLRDMLSAVKYLHSHGVVHRDLKLENFLFEGESALSPLILIDFGLSKLFDPNERIRQRVGSCYYTAPEVLNGAYDYRCDLWSLGVITYMLLSGCPPFHGRTPEEIHQSTLTAQAEFSERRFRHVSPIGIDFMQRLLNKNPDLRMTADQALAHRFIVDGGGGKPVGPSTELILQSTLSQQQSSDDIIRSSRFFLTGNRLTRMLLMLVAHVICVDKIRAQREEFLTIDKDRSGTLSTKEMFDALGHIDEGDGMDLLSVCEVNSLFQSLDVGWQYDGTNINHSTVLLEGREMRYHEYIAVSLYKRVEVEEYRIRLAFETLDIDRKGYLTAESIKSALGEDLPDAAAFAMIVEADKNCDGKVVYGEFISAWRDASTAPQSLSNSIIVMDDSFVALSEDESVADIVIDKDKAMAITIDTQQQHQDTVAMDTDDASADGSTNALSLPSPPEMRAPLATVEAQSPSAVIPSGPSQNTTTCTSLFSWF